MRSFCYSFFIVTEQAQVMNKTEIENHLANCKASVETRPFGPEVLVYKVMNKMFALVSQQEEVARVSLKCNPADAEVLVDEFSSIIPGYHLNKRHWITVLLDGDLPEGMLLDLSNKSYELVVSNLTKKDKAELDAISFD